MAAGRAVLPVAADSPLHLLLPALVDSVLTSLLASARAGRSRAGVHAQACMARAKAVEPAIHAFRQVDASMIIERARAAEVHLQAASDTPSQRLLAGVPFGVKDIIDVAGEVTGMGSPIHDANRAGSDARLVAKLRAAGGYVFGKTVTTEFAFMHPRETRNPWNPAHTPGGSSSGSAAAVAAGCVPAALATQTNGSVIRPAAFCGIVGFKPSFGAFSTEGVLSYAPTLDQPGCYARSVAGVALIAHALAEPGYPIAPQPQQPPQPPQRSQRSQHHAPGLLAVRSPVWSQAGEAMQSGFARACAHLAAAGARVDAQELPAAFAHAHEVHRVIMSCEAVRYFTPVQALHRALISDWLNRYLDQAAAIDDARYREALLERESLRRLFAAFIASHDALLTPPAPGEAPPGIETSGDPVFCSIWTLLGVPAITVPIGLGPSGLPLGMQIVGAERSDDRVLEAAAWCEDHLPSCDLLAG